ncbi:MAG: hypothetical protein M3347_00500, partial [Armatimonadota bacterium]|nr:hypothetical protein [Armatimonadota bacterium]
MQAADSPVVVAAPQAISTPSAYGRATAIHGLRARALLVGIPMLIGICFISVYGDMVAQKIQFGVLQLAPPAVAALLLLALANQGLKQLLKRELLSQTDILIVYAMLLVGVMVSTRGVIEKLIPPLAYLPYNATRENKYNELITQHLPHWLLPFTPTSQPVPAPPVIRMFFEGVPSGEEIPWYAWIGPLAAGFALIACVIFVFACLATLMRRQWMDNEQLRFPLTALPLAIIRNEAEGQPFFSNRMMWMGFSLSALVFGVNGMQSNFPDWPTFVLNIT